MSPAWEVHLVPDAVASLRSVSRSTASGLARAIEQLEREGPASMAIQRDAAGWTGELVAGDYAMKVAGRDGDRRVIVMQIAPIVTHPAYQAMDALPIAPRTRRGIGRFVEGLDLDLRYTLRALRRAPLFTAVVMITLAIGFGGATALLDIVHTVYARALPFGNGDRLVRVRNTNASPDGDVRKYNLTPSDYHVLRRDNRSLAGVIAQEGRSLSLMGDGAAERVSAIGVSPDWASTLGIRPMLGRAFSAEEDRAGTDAGVALISHALWQRRFGGDRAAIGRSLAYVGGAVTIIGVMPAGIAYPYDADVWTPWTFPETNLTASSLNVVARLRDGVTIEAARQDADRMHDLRMAGNLQRSATGFDVATMRQDFIRDDGASIAALSSAVLFLLALAFVNVTNLLVARFTTRRAELGLRAALGGHRGQQVRQLVLESIVLFTGGALSGALLSSWLRRALAMTVPDTFRSELGFDAGTVGAGVAGVVLVIGVAAGIIVGLVAAHRAGRTDPMLLVRQGGRGISRGDRRLFDVLVVAQLSLSLLLLAGASLLIARFRDLVGQPAGYDLSGVTTMRITLEADRYRDAASRHRLVQQVEERLGTMAGVEAAGITTVNPICCGDWGAPIEVEGRPVAPGDPATLVAHSYVTPGYFESLRIPLLRGTGFEPSDRPGARLTVVIDEEFARMAWPGQEALGRRVRLAREGQEWRTVVGVVPVTDHEAEMRAAWFLPYYQDPTGSSTEQLHIMVRGPALPTADAMRDVIGGIDPTLAVYGTATMEALQRERRSPDRLGAVVSAVFAVFGLLLAGFSLYGLLAYSVELRRSEIGIRMALGARRGEIVLLVLRQAVVRFAVGTPLGIVLALVANKILQGMIAGLGDVSWTTMAALAGLMATVTLIAAAAPALRATRVEALRSLRA